MSLPFYDVKSEIEIRLKNHGLPINNTVLAAAKIGAEVATDYILERVDEFVEEESGIKRDVLLKIFKKRLKRSVEGEEST